MLDFPLEGVGDNEIRVTMVSEDGKVLQQALADIPDEVDLTVERIGAYPEDASDVTAVLTERQQEILEAASILSLLTERQKEVLHAAIAEGYYASPREATHQDIAEQMDISAGTVTEHLQKIEARVFGSAVS